jgi:hypothetical protein
MPPPLPPQRTLTDIARRAEMDTASEDGGSILSEDMYDPHVAIRPYDEPFGDHHFAKSPMSIDHENYETGTEDEEEEKRGLFESISNPSLPVPASSISQGLDIGNVAGNGVFDSVSPPRQRPVLPQRGPSVKKVPPPPPARRITTGASGFTPAHSANNSLSSSVPVSTETLSLAAPVLPKRPTSRSRSSTIVAGLQEPITDSPFDN